MQISKAFLALCAAVLLILPPCVRAAETDAQAKARKALEEKLKALESQPATSATPTAAPAPVAPAAVTPVTPEPTAPAPPAASSANDDKAREAMRQKLNELQSQSPTALTNEYIPAPTPQKPPKRVAKPVRRTPTMSPRPVPPSQQPAPAPEVAEPSTPVPAPVQPPVEAPAAVQPAPVQPPPVVVTPPAVPQQPAPAPAAAPEPVRAPAAQSSGRPVLHMPPSADPAAIAKAREAVREKMSQLEPEQPATTAVAPTVAPTPGQPAPRPAEPVAPTPATSQPQAVAAAPNQTDTRSGAEAAAQSEAGKNPKSKTAKTKPEKVKPTPPPKGPVAFPALEGPPSPLSASKQQKLKDLLRLYQADQVTPEQYHQQRAKILAEP